MTGMQDGSIKMEGDFSLLVWFNQAAKLIPPKLPKPVKDKVRQARAFIKEKLVVRSNKNSRSGVFYIYASTSKLKVTGPSLIK